MGWHQNWSYFIGCYLATRLARWRHLRRNLASRWHKIQEVIFLSDFQYFFLSDMYLIHNQNQIHFLWSSDKATVMGGINLFTIFFSVYVFCWYISCLLFPFVTFPPPRFWQDLHLQPFLVWKQDSHILEKYFLWVYILTNKFYGLYILTNLFSNLKLLALALSLYLNNIFAVCTIESYENFCIFLYIILHSPSKCLRS